MNNDILENIKNSIKDAPIVNVVIENLKIAEYNPRKATAEQKEQVKTSISRFGMAVPILVNSAPEREQVIIGGHLRVQMAKELGILEVPVRYINIPDLNLEKELNIRLNKNTGDFDYEMLANWNENFLSEVGFSSEDLDNIFPPEETPEMFDLQAELEKLNITQITMQKGQVWQLGDSRLLIGDSTIEADVLKLMNGEKADMCCTDEPYILDYNSGKRHGKPTDGFGYKKDRKYLETDVLPDNFIELWTANVHKVQKEHFSIIAFENWKNLPKLWSAMEQYWKIKNLIIWNIQNRHQGFASKYKFFSKHDIALAGASPDVGIEFNNEPEEDGLQEQYESALFAISGKPHWESYEKGKLIQPTDFMQYHASDEKNSGQGVVFGTKPVEILIPYLKVLTKRGDLIIEPFGGSGSTLIAAEKLKRRCYVMEKVPTYAEVIRVRWEKLTGLKAVLISE
ncbi:MAG TPA: DNA methyltransferase [Patescibacteria group bacterium]|nr:DNA methyltransferase [Patescibacteria group bacterium]